MAALDTSVSENFVLSAEPLKWGSRLRLDHIDAHAFWLEVHVYNQAYTSAGGTETNTILGGRLPTRAGQPARAEPGHGFKLTSEHYPKGTCVWIEHAEERSFWLKIFIYRDMEDGAPVPHPEIREAYYPNAPALQIPPAFV